MCEMFESGFLIFRYDHPNVIAASGSIGLEILDQLPSIDAIILPIGGGGLIAGVATAIKQVKPGVLIYVTTSTTFLYIYLEPYLMFVKNTKKSVFFGVLGSRA